MGAGAGEDTGSHAVILPDEPEPEPRSPQDGDLEAIADRLRAAAALAERAAGDGTDVERIHLARCLSEAAAALDEQARREIVVQAVWDAGFAAGAEQCLVRKQGPGQHRKSRPDYLKPLAVAAGGALRAVSRHPGSHGTAHPVAAAFKAQLTGAKTAAALSVTGAAAVAVVAAGSMQTQPYTTHLYSPPGATASPAAVSVPTWEFVKPAARLSGSSSLPPLVLPPVLVGPSPSPSPSSSAADPGGGGSSQAQPDPAPSSSDSSSSDGAAGSCSSPSPADTSTPAPAPSDSTTTSAYLGRHRNPVAAAV